MSSPRPAIETAVESLLTDCLSIELKQPLRVRWQQILLACPSCLPQCPCHTHTTGDRNVLWIRCINQSMAV